MILIFKSSKRTHLFEGQVLTIDCEVEGKPFYFFIYIPKDKAHFSDENYFAGLIRDLKNAKSKQRSWDSKPPRPFLKGTPMKNRLPIKGYEFEL